MTWKNIFQKRCKYFENENGMLYLGNSLELLKEIPDKSIDAIITDPPYNTGMKQQNGGRLKNFFNDSYSKEEYYNLVEKVCTESYRVLKENKAVYIFINWKQVGLWIDLLGKVGFNVKNVIVWDKVIHSLNYQNYAYRYELIIYATKGKFELNNKSNSDLRNRFFTDVWRIQRKLSNEPDSIHETIKPLEVLRVPLLHSTKENDIVLDMFLSSGSTAVACKQLKRRFIGIEINKKYLDFAIKRLSQKNLFEFF